MTAPRQLSLARLAEFGVRPNRELGQNFLVDDNQLQVIDRLASLSENDVALEIGAGLGVLTAFLSPRVARVHAVEIDTRLEAALTETLRDCHNVTVHWGDAVRMDLASLDPAPNLFVANLPYNVAAPLVLDAIGGLPSIERFCVLVQREIADRLCASRGDPLYGAPSVLCGLALERTGRHAVPRTVFVPVPRVDSALVAFRRRAAWSALEPDWSETVRVVRAAFSHRRKTLGNALALAGWGSRDEVRAAGVDPDLRAEALPLEDFVTLARTRRD